MPSISPLLFLFLLFHIYISSRSDTISFPTTLPLTTPKITIHTTVAIQRTDSVIPFFEIFFSFLSISIVVAVFIYYLFTPSCIREDISSSNTTR